MSWAKRGGGVVAAASRIDVITLERNEHVSHDAIVWSSTTVEDRSKGCDHTGESVQGMSAGMARRAYVGNGKEARV